MGPITSMERSRLSVGSGAAKRAVVASARPQLSWTGRLETLEGEPDSLLRPGIHRWPRVEQMEALVVRSTNGYLPYYLAVVSSRRLWGFASYPPRGAG